MDKKSYENMSKNKVVNILRILLNKMDEHTNNGNKLKKIVFSYHIFKLINNNKLILLSYHNLRKTIRKKIIEIIPHIDNMIDTSNFKYCKNTIFEIQKTYITIINIENNLGCLK